MDYLRMVSLMVLEFSNCLMAQPLKVNLKTIKYMDLLLRSVKKFMKVTGIKISNQDKVK